MTAHRFFLFRSPLALAFCLLVGGILGADWLFYRNESEAAKQHAQQQISAIADLKIEQIAAWRAERRGDALLLRDSPVLEPVLRQFRDGGMDRAGHERIRDWLRGYIAHFDFSAVFLYDAGGRLVLATDDSAARAIDPAGEALRAQAQRVDGPVFGPLTTNPAGEPYQDIAVALGRGDRARMAGTVVLRIDPRRFLYPLIQSWPVPSVSGETLLVEERDGGILYLNELRHRPESALRLRREKDDPNLPAAWAVRGEAHVLEGRDYRDRPVLAATRPIPDSNWALVAKVDMDEVLTPLGQRFALVMLVSLVALLCSTGLAAWLLGRDRQRQIEQRTRELDAAEQLRQMKERLVEAQRVGRIGSWERDLDSGALWWSEEAYRLFETTPEAHPAPDFALFLSRVHPEDRQRVEETVRAHLAPGDAYEMDYRVLLPSGRIRHYRNFSRSYRDDTGRVVRTGGTTQDVTERRQATLALQMQSTQLQAVLEHLPQGLSVFDEQLRLQLWNEECRLILGLPPEAMFKNARFEDLIRYPAERGEYGPGDVEEQIRVRRDLALRFEPHRLERTRPGGKTHLVQGNPFYFNGKLAGFITTYTDITDRKRAEEQLRLQHQKLATIIENIPGGVSLVDGQLDFVAVNQTLVRLLDFPADFAQRLPVPFREVALFNARRGEYGPGDPEEIADRLVERARNPVPHLFERTRPDGTVLEVRGSPLPDGGFVTIYTDITSRKRTEERLLLAEKVFDNSPEAIMITDHRNRIVTVNEAFTQITGYAPQEVLGEDPRILASGQHPPEFYRQMWESLARTGHWAGEIWDRRKSGDIYPKWMTINAVEDKLSGATTHYVALFSDITERKRSEERIHHLAHHDMLTGLPNRFSLEARLEQAFAEARRHQWHVAVLFIDLDRFKIINDTLGHHVGDQLLVEVARRFTAVVRESDTVARLGGDEFVIVLPDLVDPGDAATVAGKIIEALSTPVAHGEHELHTSPSIGIGLYPGDGDDVETVMKNADTAMYHAKALGRNNFQFFAEAMNRSASERLEIEGKLRQALRRDEFTLHYQPQVAADGETITGVEALLRWNRGDEGMIAPARFIPIAEDTGLIVAIGEWVLTTACRQVRAWLDAGLPPLRLAVNLSARQLREQSLPATVARILAESGLPPRLLELEITESTVMEEPREALKVLQALKGMGLTLAIDDFGTGYSSLAYLKLFPIDHLKIDRSFVTDIERDPDDAAIAVSTIALAHSLGLNVIAEGVESEAQFELLRRHRCDEMQGYLFGRPLPAAEIEARLAAIPDRTR